MDPHVFPIDISDLKGNTLTKAEAQRVSSEKKDPITQLIRGSNQMMKLNNRQNVRDPGGLGRIDQGDIFPGFAQPP
jgi:hypothetical protein